jgi:hypothetical protein
VTDFKGEYMRPSEYVDTLRALYVTGKDVPGLCESARTALTQIVKGEDVEIMLDVLVSVAHELHNSYRLFGGRGLGAGSDLDWRKIGV